MIRTKVLKIDSLPSYSKSIKFGIKEVIEYASNTKIGRFSCTAKAKLVVQLFVPSNGIIERRGIGFSIQRR